MNILETAKHVEALIQSGHLVFESVYPSLYLDVKSKGTANWIIRYQLFGQRRQYKIGGYSKNHKELLNLEGAIKLAIDWRQKLNDGIAPKLDIEPQKQPKLITFDDCANKYLEKKRTKIKTAYVYERVYHNEKNLIWATSASTVFTVMISTTSSSVFWTPAARPLPIRCSSL